MRTPRSTSLLLALFGAFLLTLLVSGRAAAFSPIFVKPGGTGTGGTFAQATNLHNALAIAQAGDQIWVASGVYTPGVTITDTFTLTAGVALYGGFALTATQFSQRDWVANPTILSGDIDGNDHTDARGVVTSTAGIAGANSYHVLFAGGTSTSITATTRLDGFIVTAGDAAAVLMPDNSGGGFFCQGAGGVCSPHLENILFSGNRALLGGAIFDNGLGGESSPSLAHVTFAGNAASGSGGAIFNFGASGKSSPSFVDVLFAHNTAALGGGAIRNDGTFTGTSAPSFTNVAFITNAAGSYGGAIYDDGSHLGKAVSTLVNVTFAGNSAAQEGGAIYGDGTLTGVSVANLVNSILWGNTAIVTGAQIYNAFASTSFTSTLVQRGIHGSGVISSSGVITDNGGNLDADPLFVDALHDNVRLHAGSPAIDKGINSAIHESADLDGNPRLVDGDGKGTAIVDLGPYEFLITVPLTLTLAGNGSGQVVREPAGLACSAPCRALYGAGTSATLTATAATTATFAGWSGDCSGKGACHLTFDAPKQVTATFTLNSYPITIHSAGNGEGTVSKQPDQATYPFGSTVLLSAFAKKGSVFTGWSGDCHTITPCLLTIKVSSQVTATFVTHPPHFTSTPGLTATVGLPYTYSVTSANSEGGILTLTAPLRASWLHFTLTGNGTGRLSGTPALSDVGRHGVRLQVENDEGAVAVQSFTITVSTLTGSVQGLVVDEKNQGIGGATVTLSDESGRVAAATFLTASTDGDGIYHFTGVPVGDYTITATHSGDNPSAPRNVMVAANQTTSVPPITLHPGKAFLHLPLLERGQK